MRLVRSRLIALLLTLVVGLGLASSAFAHRLPGAGDLQLQALQAIGLTPGSICGGAGPGKAPPPCADETCGLCATPAAPLGADMPLVGRAVSKEPGRHVWPATAAVPAAAIAFVPPSRAPPPPAR